MTSKNAISYDENRLFRHRQKTKIRINNEGASICPKSKNRIPNILRKYKRKSCNLTHIKQRFRSFEVKSSANIEFFIFVSWPDSGRSSGGRFHENCARRKTLQLSTKMRNINVSAARKTLNYAISYVFCKLFRFPTFVSKLLCDKLANSAIILD